MRPLKAARAAAPDVAGDPRRVDQAGRLIGADAIAISPSLQAGHTAGGRLKAQRKDGAARLPLLQVIVQEGGLKVVVSQFLGSAEGLNQVVIVRSAAERLCEALPSASKREAIGTVSRDAQRLLNWHDVVDLQVGGRA
jgi:hypothetical protein